ncbi:MAG: MinD/ParA family protein [Spongiibacteraceae bacterium]|nr:MinD/ParA family protein [Spongiibacteraceae bacterium]
MPHVIAITSGKGGVGKSSITVNLGLALARGGARVCLFDADTGLANINILLGLTPRLTLEQVVRGDRRIEEIMLEAPYGLKVVPGANGISECVSLQAHQQLHLVQELARIEAAFDYLLLDTAAGVAEETLHYVAAAHQALLVITPEPTSLTDAFSLVKLMARQRRDIRFQVVVNMCPNLIVGREIFQRFQGAVKKYIGLEVEALGYLLRDESLRNAVTLQQPVALFPENDPSCRGFMRLAEALQRTVRNEPPRQRFSTWWQRQFESAGQAAGGTDGPDARLQAEQERLLKLIEQQEAAAVAPLLEAALTAFYKRHPRATLELEPLLTRVAESGRAGKSQQRGRQETVLPVTNDITQTVTTEMLALTTTPASGATSAAGSQRVYGHGYDHTRFGSQERLAEQLRQREAAGNVTEWLTQLLAAMPPD